MSRQKPHDGTFLETSTWLKLFETNHSNTFDYLENILMKKWADFFFFWVFVCSIWGLRKMKY